MGKKLRAFIANQHEFNWRYAGILFLSIIPMCYILFLMLAYKTNVPFWDDVDGTVPMIQRLFSNQWQLIEILHPHNHHRVVISRILYIIDYYFYAGNTFPLICISFLAQLGQLFLLSSQLKKTITSNTIAYACLFLTFSCLLFAAQAGQIWFWPFVVQQTLTPLFFMLAFIVTQDKSNSTFSLVLLILYSIAAIFSSANGLVVWPICFVALILFGHSWQRIMLYGVASALSVSLYLYHMPPSESSQMVISLFARIQYLLCFMGATFGLDKSKVSLVIGFVALLLYGVFLLLTLRANYLQRRSVTHLYFWIALGLFTLGSAVMGSLGRVHEGISQAMSDRYTPLVAPFWCGLFVLSTYFFQKSKVCVNRYIHIGLFSIVLFMCVAFIQTAKKMPGEAKNIQMQLKTQELALLNDHYIINPKSKTMQLHASKEVALQSLQFLKANKLALFEKPHTSTLGLPIAELGLTLSDKMIAGKFEEIRFIEANSDTRQYSFAKGLFVSGSIKLKAMQQKGEIYIVSDDSTLYGMGLLHHANRRNAKNFYWAGFVSADMIERVKASAGHVKLTAYYKPKNSRVLTPLSKGMMYV